MLPREAIGGERRIGLVSGHIRHLGEQCDQVSATRLARRAIRQRVRAFAKARWRARKGKLRIFRSLQKGIELAKATVAGDGPPPSRAPRASGA